MKLWKCLWKAVKYRHCCLFQFNISLLTNTWNQTFFSVSLSLFFCTRCQSPTLFTLAWPHVTPWHFFICLVLYCRKTRTLATFSSVCLLPPCSCLSIFLTLCSQVQVANLTVWWQNGNAKEWSCRQPDWREERSLGGEVEKWGRVEEGRTNRQRAKTGPMSRAWFEYSVGGLPVEQKPLYFLPWNKVPSDYKTESWAWVLINIEQISVHVSSDGLFSTCFFCPTSADGRACVFRGSLEVVLHLCVCLSSVSVCVCACTYACT